MCGDRDRIVGNPSAHRPLTEHITQVDRGRAFRYGLPQGLKDFRTDLVTHPADRWAQMHVKSLRAARETRGHLVERTLKDPTSRPAPTGVNGRHGPPLGIHDKDGHAVGNGHREDHARHIGGMAVARVDQVRILDRSSIRMMYPHVGTVHLLRMHNSVRPETLTKYPPSPTSSLGVTSRREEAEVERRLIPGIVHRGTLYHPGKRPHPVGLG